MTKKPQQLASLTLRQALDGLQNKYFSLDEIYTAIDQIVQAKNTELNVYLSQNEQASQQAETRAQLPLSGLPIAVKDNFSTVGLATTAASTLLNGYISQYESTVTHKLLSAGGVIYGKTNLDAWAHGSSTETSQYGRTLNPRNTEHLPGGSSGGSAAAVAADMCLGALGSETAGSIRQPSAWCGVVGLKPTYGRCSRYGVVAMASSTDSPGPIGKTVEDTAIVLNAIAGHDPYDGTTSKELVPDFTSFLNTSIKGMKIGILYRDLKGLDSIWPHFNAATQVFSDLGAHVELAQAFDPQHAISVYTIVQRAEVSSNLGRYDGIRYGHDRSYFGDEAKRRIMLGTFTLSSGYSDQYYRKAQQVRTLYSNDFEALFKKYDALISLTSPGFAKKIGASEGAAMFGELEDLLLEPSSISGLPGISVPCYQDPKTNLFLGLNIMTPKWQEGRAIQIADAFEKATQWNTWRSA